MPFLPRPVPATPLYRVAGYATAGSQTRQSKGNVSRTMAAMLKYTKNKCPLCRPATGDSGDMDQPVERATHRAKGRPEANDYAGD
jgi:hypothetical protein